MAEILTKADLVQQMTDMIPDRCRTSTDICPALSCRIIMWSFGYDHLPDEQKVQGAIDALGQMDNIEHNCWAGIGTQPTFGGEAPMCRMGQAPPLVAETKSTLLGMEINSLTDNNS